MRDGEENVTQLFVKMGNSHTSDSYRPAELPARTPTREELLANFEALVVSILYTFLCETKPSVSVMSQVANS